MAGLTERHSGDQLALESRGELGPFALGRPAVITREAFAGPRARFSTNSGHRAQQRQGRRRDGTELHGQRERQQDPGREKKQPAKVMPEDERMERKSSTDSNDADPSRFIYNVQSLSQLTNAAGNKPRPWTLKGDKRGVHRYPRDIRLCRLPQGHASGGAIGSKTKLSKS